MPDYIVTVTNNKGTNPTRYLVPISHIQPDPETTALETIRNKVNPKNKRFWLRTIEPGSTIRDITDAAEYKRELAPVWTPK